MYSSDSCEVQAVQVQTRGTQPIRFSKMFFFLDEILPDAWNVNGSKY